MAKNQLNGFDFFEDALQLLEKPIQTRTAKCNIGATIGFFESLQLQPEKISAMEALERFNAGEEVMLLPNTKHYLSRPSVVELNKSAQRPVSAFRVCQEPLD